MKHSISLLALILALGGCNLLNPYERPQTATPDAWAVSDGKAATDAAIAPDWWQGFNQPALTAMVEGALQNNFDLEAAVARVREADAQARIAGASLLPTIDATADASRSKTSGGSTGGRSIVRNSVGTQLNASYTLDFWGRNMSAAESAAALADASRFDEQTVRLTVAADVANSYFTVIGLQDRQAVAIDNLQNAEKLLDAIRRRNAVGLVSGLEVAQQENVVATQRAALPAITQQLSQNLNALAILLGKMPEDIQMPTGDLASVAVPTVAPGLPSTLLRRRPDVQNAEAQLIAANADINNARAAFFPQISLTADGGYASNALSNLFKSGSFAWSLGAGLTQPIFEGGALFGQLEYNHARYDELLASYKKSVASAFADVENALAAVAGTAAQETAQADAVRSARTAFTLSQRQFDNGIVDITTTLDTQRSLFSAQDAYVQARLAHLQAIVGLYQALGGGWQTAKK